MANDQLGRGRFAHRQRLMALTAVVFIGLATSIGSAAEISSAKDIDRVLTIDSVQSEAGRISGVIRNHSSQSVSDVRLLIQETYRWPIERKPTGEDPSAAVVRVIAGPIAPGDSLRFNEVVSAGEAGRGSFEAHAQILGYVYQETRPEMRP